MTAAENLDHSPQASSQPVYMIIRLYSKIFILKWGTKKIKNNLLERHKISTTENLYVYFNKSEEKAKTFSHTHTHTHTQDFVFRKFQLWGLEFGRFYLHHQSF